CKSCVSSAWNCNWCMHENQCTYNTSTCTRRVIVGENSPTNSLIKGLSHCPSFHLESPLLVPNGARKELRVEVRNLIPSQDGFQCIVEIEQAKEQVAARVQDNNIICHETTIHPISGPVEGGTLVTIEGSNLGASLEEIKDRLSIGGVPCTPIEYNVSI
ncbi:PREDICTED: plexin-B-like, partial [Rhagoletis zephyria]|uniref:plexin-B-like n=1 Tax=Rhagoletis zephyria TaxID=28612 RepID=UPI0008119604